MKRYEMNIEIVKITWKHILTLIRHSNNDLVVSFHDKTNIIAIYMPYLMLKELIIVLKYLFKRDFGSIDWWLNYQFLFTVFNGTIDLQISITVNIKDAGFRIGNSIAFTKIFQQTKEPVFSTCLPQITNT